MPPKWTIQRGGTPLPASLPDGLGPLTTQWLIGVWHAPAPMCCQWVSAAGFAQRADPVTLALRTGDEQWPALRAACGFRWHRGALDATLARFADHGWLDRVDGELWCLAWPQAPREPARATLGDPFI